MIIADENLDARIIKAIRAIGIEVYSIAEEQSGITDEMIVEIARETNKIILTRDKDFGDIVFADRQRGISVILLRYDNNLLPLITRRVLQLLANDGVLVRGKFITVTNTQVRSRTI